MTESPVPILLPTSDAALRPDPAPVPHEVPRIRPRTHEPTVTVDEIKPRETSYAGCRFRSRLEARWAVFFDALGIEWLYEPECYTVGPIGSRRGYLPDFYLPQQAVWVEVKGDPAGIDLDLMAAAAHPQHGLPFAYGSNRRGYRLINTRLVLLGPVPRAGGAHVALSVVGGDVVALDHVLVAGHLGCTRHGFTRLGEPTKLTGDVLAEVRRDPAILDRAPIVTPCPHAATAYRDARSARFEYGESGALAPFPVEVAPSRRSRGTRPTRRVPVASVRKKWLDIVAVVERHSKRRAQALRHATVVTAASRRITLEFPSFDVAAVAQPAPTTDLFAVDVVAAAASDVLGGTWTIRYNVRATAPEPTGTARSDAALNLTALPEALRSRRGD